MSNDDALAIEDIDYSWHRNDLAILNRMARILYRLRGYVTPAGFDFSAAKHPHEREAYAAAAAMLNFLREEGFEDPADDEAQTLTEDKNDA